MQECRVHLVFNSALVALDEKTGVFDEKAFGEQILPIRGKIMQLDGISGCHIARYGVEVKYFPNIVTETAVNEHILNVFIWASQNGFFPLHGGRSIRVTRDTD